MVTSICVELIFMLQKYNDCQEKAVEQTFVVDSSRLLSFAVGYIIGFQNFDFFKNHNHLMN